MNKFISYLQNHPKMNKGIFFILITIMGCFSFPFQYSRSFLSFYKVFLIIVGYLYTALYFMGIYGRYREGLVYVVSLFLTGLGMISNYILEYGEVSNTRDFTKFNIVSFLIVVPIYTVIVYHFIPKITSKVE